MVFKNLCITVLQIKSSLSIGRVKYKWVNYTEGQSVHFRGFQGSDFDICWKAETDNIVEMFSKCIDVAKQGLNQDLETGYPKLTIVKILGVKYFKGYQNIYSDYNHKHVFNSWNKTYCPYSASQELYQGEKRTILCLKQTF